MILVEEIPGGHSTKSQIVEILSREWPLSCRKIYNRLSKERGRNITYQAVHKATLQMTDENVLVKSGLAYSLNLDWVNKIERFSRDVSSAYLEGRKVPSLEGDLVQHNFESGYETIRFLSENFLRGKFIPMNSEKIRIYVKVQHMWNPFVLAPGDFGKLRELSGKIEAFVACKGSTQLDRIISRFYNALGIKTALGAEVSETPELAVVGETVIQIFNPPEMRALLSKTYQTTKTLFSPELIRNFNEIAHGRMKVTVLINRNALAAEGIKGEISTFFLQRKGKK
ncbi:MAG: hypothetical protein V1820_04615 [archaeon]